MKALALDTAATCITIAAKNENHTVTVQLDIGMKQAEKLLPAIDYVLKEVGLTPAELDYTVICDGPGSFTGLRLGMASLKAISLANNIPVYGVSTLDAYAFAYKNFDGTVIPAIDAKKDRFYAALYSHGKCISGPFDEEPEDILKHIDLEDKILACGIDAELFSSIMRELSPTLNITTCEIMPLPTAALFKIAEEGIADNSLKKLEDYDGPLYIRKSEAEENLNK
ncbi:MAG: tRNA (adenosine(37)-N6)-threonylcarbamoyltransferase complex dimerization subunit type 1 TsaB [Treponema sp.]|nr:tRNA (adenosine(37)-N6)-threonylcarbamoyltransferase complex dimerization subunit type 1 TsaB [Treponema sp.]